MPDYPVVFQPAPTMYFIGVTTGKSSINKVFPLWMRVLGRPEVVLKGWDFKIHDDAEKYREAVHQIKTDPNSLGALVTTHKIDLFSAARDMFDYCDPYAQITGEVSSISKLDGRLEGHAKDPLTAGYSMDAIVGDNYFGRTGGHILCLGAGGSAVATLLYLINKPFAGDRPEKFIVVNRSAARLDHMREMVDHVGTDIEVEYVENQDPKVNDELMQRLPDCSMVINATGMGKDSPGSPITDDGRFPLHGIAWEFNYRGELDFLHQARRQEAERDLTVVDGWVYFLHGWSQVIAQVLHVELTPVLFARLDEAASTVRGK